MSDQPHTDYPTGDGIANCPKCKGRGVVLVPKDELPAYALPGTTKFCECVYKRDLLANLIAGWKPLARVPSVKGSPLIGKTQQNMWVRADPQEVKGHLRAAILKHSPRWRFKVITDADLMTTWLYSANEVHDADVGLARVRGENTASRVSDLVEPWDLLIIRLGFKEARNQAMPEVLLEALLHREHLDRPTWVVDTPYKPLHQGHRAWDENVQAHMVDYFEFLDLSGGILPDVPMPPIPVMTDFGIGDGGKDQGEGGLLDESGRIKARKRNWRDE